MKNQPLIQRLTNDSNPTTSTLILKTLKENAALSNKAKDSRNKSKDYSNKKGYPNNKNKENDKNTQTRAIQ